VEDLQTSIFRLILALPAFVAGLTLHEFAHAWMGNRLGDDTARRLGRVSLDPMVHIDPFGAIFFVISSLVGFGIGWAKPVPFNPRNLENPRRDSILIAIAGPISNLIQVPFWILGLWIVGQLAERSGVVVDLNFIKNMSAGGQEGMIYSVLATVFAMGVLINIMLAAFNMIPIPPLDGHYVLEGLGPPAITDFFNSIRPFSFILLIVLMQLNVISMILMPFMSLAQSLIVLGIYGVWLPPGNNG